MLLRYHHFSNGILGILIYLFHLSRNLKNSSGVDLPSCIRNLSQTAISTSLSQRNRPNPKRPVDSSKSVPHLYGVPIRRWRSRLTGAIIVTDNRSAIFRNPCTIFFHSNNITTLINRLRISMANRCFSHETASNTNFFGGRGFPCRCTAHHLIPWTASDRLLHHLLHFTDTAVVTATERWNA